MHMSRMTTYLDALMLRCTPSEYFSVTLSNQALNREKNRPAQPDELSVFDGFNRSVQRAGVSDRAMNAESITEIAIVIANCW